MNTVGFGQPPPRSNPGIIPEELFPLVYHELRELAAGKLRNERPGQTLQATALVHEVYLRITQGHPQHWVDRGHFLAAAAEAMRRILVDRARRKQRQRHGGDLQRQELREYPDVPELDPTLILTVDEAISQLAEEDATTAAVVRLRFFAGLSIEETAQTLEISRATAYRHWAYARAWLRLRLPADSPEQ